MGHMVARFWKPILPFNILVFGSIVLIVNETPKSCCLVALSGKLSLTKFHPTPIYVLIIFCMLN